MPDGSTSFEPIARSGGESVTANDDVDSGKEVVL
jgi:hypothetical protein